MKFDVDISGMEPGQTIPQETCERVIDLRRDDDQYLYQFRLLQLTEWIQRELWKVGCRWTLKQNGGSIRILTHAEASEYNAQQFNISMAKMRRSHKRQQAVEVASLTPDEVQKHDAAVCLQSRILQGIRGTRANDLRPEPIKRGVSMAVTGKE